MANKKSTPKASPAKPKAENLFYLQIPAEHPKMSPDPLVHYGSAASHLKEQIENLEAVEQLAAIEQENETVLALSYGITAVIKKLKDVHAHFTETNVLVRPFKA